MFSSIGPERESKPQAPRSSARLYAAAASCTRNAIAQIDGPCSRAKRCANESGSALRMKLTPPCRYSVTRLCRCLATALKPICSNSAPIAAGSGAAYSMNSKPSVPIGFGQAEVVSVIAVSSVRASVGAVADDPDDSRGEGRQPIANRWRDDGRRRKILPR